MEMKHLEKRQGFSEPRCSILVETTFRSPSGGILKAAATRGRGLLKVYNFSSCSSWLFTYYSWYYIRSCYFFILYGTFVVIANSGGSPRTVVRGGTDRVSQTFPPITAPSPITVRPPRMVAPE